MTTHRASPRSGLIATAAAVTLSCVAVCTSSTIGSRTSGRVVRSPESARGPGTTAPSSPALPSSDNNVQGLVVSEPMAPMAWQRPQIAPVGPTGNPCPLLPHFYTSLRQLELGDRNEHVRVVWLGDSHTQPDFWTHAVRATLQDRFGSGGPGFIHVGWTTSGYRHEGVTLSATGRWSVQPPTLVTKETLGDGVFGLGGLRLQPRGSDCEASIEVEPSALPGPATWDIALRFVRVPSSVQLEVAGAAPVTLYASPSDVGQLQHWRLRSSEPGGTLTVRRPTGEVQLLGAVVETEGKAGVVVDSIGLNGATVRSTLAWDATAWVTELARRRPDLVVLAFGTNESSDLLLRPERHMDRIRELIARLRRASPETDCLLFGPIDRSGPQYANNVERIGRAQEAVAKELGCAFWSGQVAMGGKGSIDRWARSDPPLAPANGVHLFPRGYVRLGELLVQDMLTAYLWGSAPDTDPPVQQRTAQPLEAPASGAPSPATRTR